MEAPPSPLSSRPELRRSVVERSAVSAVLPWECFSTERSVVERSAVSAVLPWECFSTERSVVERSAASAVLPWECFSTERSVVERSAVADPSWRCFRQTVPGLPGDNLLRDLGHPLTVWRLERL